MDKGNIDSSNTFSYDTFGGGNKANPRKSITQNNFKDVRSGCE